MNLIQLVNDLRLEASVSGSRIQTVVNQTGETARLASWIRDAYIEIQNMYFDWRFLRKKGVVTTTAGLSDVAAPDDLNIWDVGRFYDDTGMKLDLIEESDLDCALTPSTGRPQMVILMDDNNLRFYPTPDAGYTYTFDYFCTPFELVADTDVPAFPAQFHKIITARAMIYYANYEAAAEVKVQGSELWQTFLPRLIASQAPHKAQTYGRSNPALIQVVVE